MNSDYSKLGSAYLSNVREDYVVVPFNSDSACVTNGYTYSNAGCVRCTLKSNTRQQSDCILPPLYFSYKGPYANTYTMKNRTKADIFNATTRYTEPAGFASMKEGFDYFIIYDNMMVPDLILDGTYYPSSAKGRFNFITITPSIKNINGDFGLYFPNTIKQWKISNHNSTPPTVGSYTGKNPASNASHNGKYTITSSVTTAATVQTRTKVIYIFVLPAPKKS